MTHSIFHVQVHGWRGVYKCKLYQVIQLYGRSFIVYFFFAAVVRFIVAMHGNPWIWKVSQHTALVVLSI